MVNEDQRNIWEPGTEYEEGSFVYPTTYNQFFYRCIQSGESQSTNSGYSSNVEPIWLTNKNTKDGILVWEFVLYILSTSDWQPNTLYNVGDNVVPTSGPILWGSNYYMYSLKKIIYEPDWPKLPGSTINDGTTIWEANVSSSRFIPRRLYQEALNVEAFKAIDYLLNEELPNINDVKYKHIDRSKLQTAALYSYVYETGYSYVADIFDLTDEDLVILTGYLKLIHFLKGTRNGLELVFKLLKMNYELVEWWEKDPKDEPDTYDLTVDLNLTGAKSNSLSLLSIFLREYVYPIVKNLVFIYTAELVHMACAVAGFSDQELPGDNNPLANCWVHTMGTTDSYYWGEAEEGPKFLITQDGREIYTQDNKNILVSNDIEELQTQGGDGLITENGYILTTIY